MSQDLARVPGQPLMNQRRAYRVLWIAAVLSFLASFGIALPYPVLTPLLVVDGTPLSQWFGLEPKLLLGLALGAYPLGMLVGSNVIGSWSDQYGRRPVILWTMVGAMLGYGLSIVAIMNYSFTLLLLSRLLAGFCEGNVAVFRAMASDLGDYIPRTKIFSWSLTATFLGWTFGPLAGGLLVEWGAERVFMAGLVMLLAGWLLVFFSLRGEARPQQKPQQTGQAWTLFSLADIRAFAWMHLFACLAVNAFYEFYPLWLVERFNSTGLGIAWFTLALQVGMLSSSMFLMRYSEQRFGLLPTMRGSLLLLALGLLLVPTMPVLAAAMLMFTVIGVMNSTFFGTFMADYSERFRHYGQGRILGLITLNFSLSAVIMAFGGGLLSLLGASWVLVFGGLLALLSLLIGLPLHARPMVTAEAQA